MSHNPFQHNSGHILRANLSGSVSSPYSEVADSVLGRTAPHTDQETTLLERLQKELKEVKQEVERLADLTAAQADQIKNLYELFDQIPRQQGKRVARYWDEI